MKVFYITGFTGHWPVGTSAIVVATNPVIAAALLEQQLEEQGLKQTINPNVFKELDLTVEHAVVLQDGDC